MWYLVVLWYRDAKPKAIARFRLGIVNKEQCRAEISKDRLSSISMGITLVLFTLWGAEEFARVCDLIPQDAHFFGIAVMAIAGIGLLLFILKLVIKHPFLSLCMAFIFIPFGGSHHPTWRHRARHM